MLAGSRLVPILVLAGMLAAVVAAVLAPLAAPADPSGLLTAELVVENSEFVLLAVGRTGLAYGVLRDTSNPAWRYRLFRSSDEGRIWTPLYDFPSSLTLKQISVLSSGTLLAMLDSGHQRLWRSGDGGATWSEVLSFPDYYGVLTPHSVADDGAHVFVGSYNVLPGESHPNWVWRSSDDGRSWSVVRETSGYRHVHGVRVDPFTGDVYVLYGDASAAIERSRDAGATWEVLCTGTRCLAVDIAFPERGVGVFGQDTPFQTPSLQRLDLGAGATQSLRTIAGPSYSALAASGLVLVGTTHEPGSVQPPGDESVHLYASDDGGRTFADVLSRPYRNPSTYVDLRAQFSFPNGDVPVQMTGYGTLVVRIGRTPSTPAATSVPEIGGQLVEGEALAASPGSWSGSPTSFGYRWQRCDGVAGSCAVVTGVTGSSYQLGTVDVGRRLQVTVTATNAAGSASASSAPTGVVAARPAPPPAVSPPVTRPVLPEPPAAPGSGGPEAVAPPAAPSPPAAAPTPALLPPAIVFANRARVRGIWYWSARLAAGRVQAARVCTPVTGCHAVVGAACSGLPRRAVGDVSEVWNAGHTTRLYHRFDCALRLRSFRPARTRVTAVDGRRASLANVRLLRARAGAARIRDRVDASSALA